MFLDWVESRIISPFYTFYTLKYRFKEQKEDVLYCWLDLGLGLEWRHDLDKKIQSQKFSHESTGISNFYYSSFRQSTTTTQLQ